MVLSTPQNDKIEIQIKLMEVASKEYLQLELNQKRHQPAFVPDSNTVEFYFESRQQRNNADCVLQAHFADGSTVSTPYYFKIKQRGGRSGTRTPKKQKTANGDLDSVESTTLLPQNMLASQALARLSVSNDLCPDAGCQGALVRMENVKKKEDIQQIYFGDRSIVGEDVKELEGEVYFKVPDLDLRPSEKRSVRIIIITDQPFIHDFLYYQRAVRGTPQKVVGAKKSSKKRKDKDPDEEGESESESEDQQTEDASQNELKNDESPEAIVETIKTEGSGEATIALPELTKGTSGSDEHQTAREGLFTLIKALERDPKSPKQRSQLPPIFTKPEKKHLITFAEDPKEMDWRLNRWTEITVRLPEPKLVKIGDVSWFKTSMKASPAKAPVNHSFDTVLDLYLEAPPVDSVASASKREFLHDTLQTTAKTQNVLKPVTDVPLKVRILHLPKKFNASNFVLHAFLKDPEENVLAHGEFPIHKVQANRSRTRTPSNVMSKQRTEDEKLASPIAKEMAITTTTSTDSNGNDSPPATGSFFAQHYPQPTPNIETTVATLLKASAEPSEPRGIKEEQKAEEQTIESGSVPPSEMQVENQPIVLRSYDIPMTEMLVDPTLEDQAISAAVEEVLKGMPMHPDDLNQ